MINTNPKSNIVVKLNSIALVFYLLFMGVFYSCVKEEPDLNNAQVKLNPGIGLPTVHAHYTLSSIFDTEETPDLLTPNEDNVLTVKYNEKVFSQSASEFITFDQEISSSIQFNKKSRAGKFILKDTIEFKFSNDQAPVDIGAKLYEIEFSTARFLLSDEGYDLPVTSTVEIKFPTIIDPISGDTASLNHTIGEQKQDSLEMSGYIANFINEENIVNGLPIVFSYDAPFPSKGFKLNYSFTLINYKSIKGYFGNFEYNLGETNIPLDFYSGVDSIQIEFETADVSINYINSFGINLDVFLKNLSAVSINDEDLTIDFLPDENDPFRLRAPAIDSTLDTTITYDVNDALDLLSKNPKKISFEPTAIFNPEPDTNYITYDSQFALDVGINIPLKFWASVIAYKDKFAFDGSSLNNITQLEYLGLLLTSQNVLPLDARIDVIFTNGTTPIYQVGGDSGFQILSNLDDNGVPVEGEPVEQILDIDKDQFENLKQADSLELRISLKTARADEGGPGNRKYVAFTADLNYSIDISLKLVTEGEFVLPSDK